MAKEKSNPFPQSRRLVKLDGTIAHTWDGKLHSWTEAALVTPEGKKKYFLYGFEYTKDEWDERRKQRNGLPFFKNPSFGGDIRM